MKKYTADYIANVLAPAVKASKSYAEVCRKLHMKPGGGNQVYIRDRIKEAGLDTSQFLGMGWAAGTKHNKRTYEYLSDEYYGFRVFLQRIRARSQRADIHLSLQDLKDQWKAQQGRCAYSGVLLELPTNTKKHNRLKTASLDRKNSLLGYERDNIQFVSVACNFAKNGMSHEEMLEFCKLMKNAP